MKKLNQAVTLFIIATLVGCNTDRKAMKSFHPGQEWLDDRGIPINAHGGGIMFYQERYYWYGEHKVEGESGNSAQVGVHVYTSEDLYNWKDEGIALKVDEPDAASDIARGCILERPKVIYNENTGKFVMWFHLELKGMGYDAARSGVAVSDHPTGPFTYLHSFRPNAGSWPVNVQEYHRLPVADTVKEKYCGGKGCLPAHVDSMNILGRDFSGGQMARDMALFVDDNGKAYQLYASEENSTLHISELTDDYLSYSGKYARAFPDRYMEAPAIFKTSNGKYYFMGSDCTGWSPNAARSAVADQIFGPWTELGNPCRGIDSATTFNSQGTFVLPVQGKKDAFIFMADRWTPENPIDGKYIWLPVKSDDNKIVLEWQDEWDLHSFTDPWIF
jgi:beta-xylosidase